MCVCVCVCVWRAWTGRSDVRGLALGLALCVGHRHRTLSVVGVHGAHHEGRGGRTSTAGTCHVLLVGVDGRELRTLGVVGAHGAHREGRGGRTNITGGARHAGA